MVKLIRQGVYFMEGHLVKETQAFMTSDKREKALKNTVLYSVLLPHATAAGELLEVKADAALASGRRAVELMQTLFALGADSSALPLTLAGVRGEDFGTLRADENAYLYSAAKRAGATFVPAGLANGEEYLADCTVKCGQVVLADKSAGLGALGVMELGAGEKLAEVLAGNAFEIEPPQTVAVYLRGKPRKGVGATDVALEILQAIGKSDFAEGKILEVFGTGLSNLSVEFRTELDGLLSLTGCLTTVWETDEKVDEYFAERGRKAYKHLAPKQPAYYDWGITVDLSRVEPMIALPVSREILPLAEYLKGEGVQKTAACAHVSGGYETLCETAEILRGAEGTPSFALCASPASGQAYKNLAENGVLSALLGAGAKLCAADSAAGLSFEGGLALATARHWESAVAVMDARSIAATAKHGGKLTSALDLEYNKRCKKFKFDGSLYAGAYRGKKANEGEELFTSQSVSEIKPFAKLPKNLLAKVLYCTKDSLSENDLYTPETYLRHRSAPDRLAAFTLAERDVSCRERSAAALKEECGKLSESVKKDLGEFLPPKNCVYNGAIVAGAIGLSQQSAARTALAFRLFGCQVFILKREPEEGVRSALIGAGILPLMVEKIEWKAGDTFYFEGLAEAVKRGDERIVCKVFSRGKTRDAVASIGTLSQEERKILLAGGNLNYHKVTE